MPFLKLQFKQGINRDQTNYTGEGGWWDCDKIRFFSGYPQKIGGWLRYTSETFLGTCRQMFNWITSFTDNLLAVGTNLKVYLEVGGIFYDITPLRTTLTTSATDDCIETTNGSNIVTVNVAGHGCIAGSYVTISGVTGNVGGIPDSEINAEHQVASIDPNGNFFTIIVTTSATSTVAAGGGSSIDIACQIEPGFSLVTAGYGFGTGVWNGDMEPPTLVSPDTDNCIDTTNGSNIVNINVIGHGLTTGDYVGLQNVGFSSTGTAGVYTEATNVGGILVEFLEAPFQVTVVDPDNFTIAIVDPPGILGVTIDPTTLQTPVNATSTTSGGGNLIAIVPFDGATSYGWGLASSQPVFLPQRDWFFDNFEDDLVMTIREEQGSSGNSIGGKIYIWTRNASDDPIDPPVPIATALNTRAILLEDIVDAADVPESAMQILVSQNNGHLMAFGCQPYGGASGDFDPLLIRWAAQNAPYFWTPGNITVPPANADLSTAGFIRVSRGSKIVRAIPNRQEILVYTDASLYSLQYTGTNEVFAIQELADNISLISPRAVTTTNNVSFWMGIDKFYMYDGRVQPLPTTVREYVFKDLNFAQADQIVSGTNEGFNEVWWFYPSGTSTWVNRYVIFNYLDQCWYFGTIDRTAWLDTSLRPYPYGAYTPPPANPVGAPYNQGPGVLYQHEFGINDDTAPMVSYIQSNDFDIQQNDGETFMLTRRIIPDINFSTSTAQQPEVDITVRSRNFPGSQFQTDPSDSQRVIETSFGLYTNQIFVRARGRQLALKIASDDLGVQWQLGSPRLDARPDGKQ